MTKDELKLVLEALKNSKQSHYYCEDTWYSCPQHDDGCANDFAGDECNCGADKVNAEIEKALTALQRTLANNALDKKAENARELGLDYEPAPVQQEPVGNVNELFDEAVIEQCGFDRELLVYTSPPAQRRPLTANQIREWWASENGLEDCVMAKLEDFERVVRKVEAAQNIKENT